MKRLIYTMFGIGLLILCLLNCISCHPDYVVNLGCGYWYAYDGGDTNMISAGEGEGPTIDYSVLDYDYNRQFIIAKQKPAMPRNVIYADYDYAQGFDAIYYWIIEKKTNRYIGPVDSLAYIKGRVEFGVPDNLQLK